MKSKFLKCGIATLLASSSLLSANETNNESVGWTEGQHLGYISHEFLNWGMVNPSIGYRYQVNNWILDVNVGYKYLKVDDTSLHASTASANIFYVLCNKNDVQTYGGLGISGEYFKNQEWLEEGKEYNCSPSITLGRDHKISKTKKVFYELSYKPYVYGKTYKGKSHATSFKIGIGF